MVDKNDDLYVTDWSLNSISKITKSGLISHFSDFKEGIVYYMTGPHAIAMDNAGNIYISESANPKISKFTISR